MPIPEKTSRDRRRLLLTHSNHHRLPSLFPSSGKSCSTERTYRCLAGQRAACCSGLPKRQRNVVANVRGRLQRRSNVGAAITVLAGEVVSISSAYCAASKYFECLRPHPTVLLFFQRESAFLAWDFPVSKASALSLRSCLQRSPCFLLPTLWARRCDSRAPSVPADRPTSAAKNNSPARRHSPG